LHKSLPFRVHILPDLQPIILKSGSQAVGKDLYLSLQLDCFILRFHEAFEDRQFVLVLLNFIVCHLSSRLFRLFQERALLAELGIFFALKVVAGHFAVHEDCSPCRFLFDPHAIMHLCYQVLLLSLQLHLAGHFYILVHRLNQKLLVLNQVLEVVFMLPRY
jgi:hypothetical protein